MQSASMPSTVDHPGRQTQLPIQPAKVPDVELTWATLFAQALEGKDVKDLLMNVGAGGGAAAEEEKEENRLLYWSSRATSTSYASHLRKRKHTTKAGGIVGPAFGNKAIRVKETHDED